MLEIKTKIFKCEFILKLTIINSLQVNISNIFRENNYFPKETIFVKRMVSLTFLQISSVSDLIEDSHIFRSAPVFYLLQFSLLQTDTSCSLRKLILCACVRKGAITSQCCESSFDFMDPPLKGSWMY